MAPASSQLSCSGNCSPSPRISGTMLLCALRTDPTVIREGEITPPQNKLLPDSREQEVLKKLYTQGEIFPEVSPGWARAEWARIACCKWHSPLPSSPYLNFLSLLETWYNITFINPRHSSRVIDKIDKTHKSLFKHLNLTIYKWIA